ncbi:peptide-methionine (S)-S-oxide reductase [Candidatus Woesebacteria bacterium RIFCSPLOWO2_01_FULL_37_19]|uniref:Peptide methionine sulfoxide reductase MsrA n=2 Tax=Candidatus Woeseibacteriota TaxID=1752722 RepID=A0A1F8B1N7_9BACT|nr:MAG: peptide-methionine (S)-S-oxide reductase [Candidatus Woesebacteria bacterium RIFCSPHIGHO2_01_FULL_38_26b]OGM57912.1 MAG: peptide-methionine (S)-S-oxide reductase [Candidatus Woesebacteria bacterium RIFCSPLOWO2_01_FULL_37_19]
MLETITLGGGCFWCTEAVFKRLKGVERVESGYSGGKNELPSYEQVSSGITGHAEVVEISFDPKAISLREILEVFFKTHDPTTLNKQGADVGTQYRSVIFYRDPNQKKIAEQTKKEVEKSEIYSNKPVTEITAFTKFYKAEGYHQDYYEKNKNAAYCKLVIDPKIQKLYDVLPALTVRGFL